MFNDRHSIGAYYQNSWNRHHILGAPFQARFGRTAICRTVTIPMSTTNPQLCRDIMPTFTIAGCWASFQSILMRITCGIKSKEFSFSDELSEMGEDRVVSTVSTNHNRMFAEKLVVSHPLERKDTRLARNTQIPALQHLFSQYSRSSCFRQQSGRKQHSRLCGDGAAIRALQYRGRTALRAREIRLLRYGATP